MLYTYNETLHMFRVLCSLNKVHHWFFPRFGLKNSIAQYCPLLEYCPARDFPGFPGRVIPGRVFHLNPDHVRP